jgi:hypothetical protein
VALQEVELGPGESNQAEELLGALGYQLCFERRDGEYVGDPGIAITSRLPILDSRLIELAMVPTSGFSAPCSASAGSTAWLDAWVIAGDGSDGATPVPHGEEQTVGALRRPRKSPKAHVAPHCVRPPLQRHVGISETIA